MKLEMVIIGSGAGVPTKNRFGTSIALCAADKIYLLDCGAPVSSLLYRVDKAPTCVEAILITHFHADHVSGIPLLIQQLQFSGRTSPLTIFGPPGTKMKLWTILQYHFILEELLPFKLLIKDMKPEETIVCGESSLTFSFFPTAHFLDSQLGKRPDKYGSLYPISYGIIIEAKQGRIIYSGDVGNVNDTKPYISRCDLLIHELAHIGPEALRDFAVDNCIPRLIVTHIHSTLTDQTEEIYRVIREGYKGELVVAEDLTAVKLDFDTHILEMEGNNAC